MKKLLVIALVMAMMLPLVGIAEEKYAGMSLSELQAEYTAILQAMWKTDEWQEVRVPAGVYKVGEEIPAGEWTLKPANQYGFATYFGTKLDITKTSIDWDEMLGSQYVDAESYPSGWSINLVDGLYITFDEIVIFTKPVKGQGFTFK